MSLIRCAKCGKMRDSDTNHWFTIRHFAGNATRPPFVHIEPFWKRCTAEAMHVCGMTCLAIKVQELVQEQIRVRAKLAANIAKEIN